MITKDSIENLKNHIEIVDVISQFLELKKSGANFKACCPFHGEDTPSFVVSPAKQIFHCFGCGVGGDSIKFIMDYEKLSYPEAIEKLASMYNVALNYDNNYKQQDTSIMDKVNDYYQKLLTTNDTAKEYLQSRGISANSIEKFEIGYAPTSNETINFLKQNLLNLADAKDFGIIDNGQNGLYARFIQRITFPIRALNDKIVGFGGRTITGHNAKYINSPQTKIFNKSRLLYGYSLAKDNIYKKNQIIVTEGYLDVVMLHQAGFNNAVATLGTALTQEHLPILKRGNPKIIVAYDGDKAGLNAAFKASKLLSHSDFEGGVIIFPQGVDPADMVHNKQIEELNNIFSNPIDFVAFALDFIISQYDLNTPLQKQKAWGEANEYLQALSPIIRSEYTQYIASKLNINQNIINISSQPQRRKTVQLASVDISELEIIKTLLENDKLIDIVLNTIDPDMFVTHKAEFEMLINEPDNPQLRGLLIREDIKTYDENSLKQRLNMMLINYYTNQLTQVKYSDIPNKAKQLRKLQEKIFNLKHNNSSILQY